MIITTAAAPPPSTIMIMSIHSQIGAPFCLPGSVSPCPDELPDGSDSLVPVLDEPLGRTTGSVDVPDVPSDVGSAVTSGSSPVFL